MKTKSIKFENKGSLITIAETNQCLGYLMYFEGRGVYDASLGLVDVTPEDAKTHNALLEEAEIKGLDENCQVGQMGTLFFNRNTKVVHTWLGSPVSDNVKFTAGLKVITFERKGKQFRGFLQKEADCFNFKRVS